MKIQMEPRIIIHDMQWDKLFLSRVCSHYLRRRRSPSTTPHTLDRAFVVHSFNVSFTLYAIDKWSIDDSIVIEILS